MSDIDLVLARKAYKLGGSARELGEKLGVSTSDAITLVAVGRGLSAIDAAALTEPEILLMQTLASLERAGLKRGQTRSSESRTVSRLLRKGPGWCAATCRKRLFTKRFDKAKKQYLTGLGFVDLTGNGFLRLTPAGWAVVHALDGQS